jgi:excisionase family DNA binding protein
MEMATVIEVEQAYFRPEEAARYLRIGRSKMYTMISDGTIPCAIEGGLRIVRKADLDEFVAGRIRAREPSRR